MTTDEHMESFVSVFGNEDAFDAGDFVELDPDRALRYFKNETIATVAGMQLRVGSLFSEIIQGKIDGYRVEMNRSVHPATFHVMTWK